MRIGVIGTGYVGLVTGACFADIGVDVVCVDKDPAKIKKLENGEIPIYEPGLDAVVARNVAAGRLRFTMDTAQAVKGADAVFIAVGTPPARNSDRADLSQIFQAAKDIAACIDNYTVVVTKSTVPVGTSRRVAEIIAQTAPDVAYDVASNPEFLREGSALGDFMNPERVVVGVNTEKAADVMRALYKKFSDAGVPVLVTSPETSELIKYAANAFLATKVTFINEIARLCEVVGADVEEVSRGMGLDSRIGTKFLKAGPGVGGSCFPKDTRALMETGREFGTPVTIVESAIMANKYTQKQLARRVVQACGGDVRGKTIGVLGLAFKPDTDDMRDAPAEAILPLLEQAGATIVAYDPVAMDNAKKTIPEIGYANGIYAVAENADAVLLLTEWPVFRDIDMTRLAGLMRKPLFIDYRNMFTPADMAKTPFHYVSLGRPDVFPQKG